MLKTLFNILKKKIVLFFRNLHMNYAFINNSHFPDELRQMTPSDNKPNYTREGGPRFEVTLFFLLQLF